MNIFDEIKNRNYDAVVSICREKGASVLNERSEIDDEDPLEYVENRILRANRTLDKLRQRESKPSVIEDYENYIREYTSIKNFIERFAFNVAFNKLSFLKQACQEETQQTVSDAMDEMKAAFTN